MLAVLLQAPPTSHRTGGFAGGSEATEHTGEGTGPVLEMLTDRWPVTILSHSARGVLRAQHAFVWPQKREQGTVFDVFKITKLE